jgi:hypothetical protein
MANLEISVVCIAMSHFGKRCLLAGCCTKMSSANTIGIALHHTPCSLAGNKYNWEVNANAYWSLNKRVPYLVEDRGETCSKFGYRSWLIAFVRQTVPGCRCMAVCYYHHVTFSFLQFWGLEPAIGESQDMQLLLLVLTCHNQQLSSNNILSKLIFINFNYPLDIWKICSVLVYGNFLLLPKPLN